MNLTKYFNLIADSKKKRDSLQQEINDLIKRESELAAAADDAAANGDVDKYMEIKAEKDKVSSIIYVKRSYMDKMPKATTEKDAFDAWSDYASDYNAKLRKGLAAFEDEKAKLCRLYSDLVTMQQEALSKRDEIAADSGVDKETFKMNFIPVGDGNFGENGHLRLIGFNNGDADACYYLANYCKKNDKALVGQTFGRDSEELRITNVVVNRIAE